MGWHRFIVVRMAVFSLTALGAAAVLGMAIHQATLFLHNTYDKPYLIFAIVVAALTLIACLALSAKYSLYTHIGCIAFLAILWLALASYTTDRIGYVQCESLDGQTRPAQPLGKTTAQYNAVSWCRELKAMMAFAWFDWALFMIAIVSWIRLSEHEENTYGEGDEHVRHEERAMEEGGFANGQYLRREGLQAGYGVPGVANGGVLGGGGLGARYVSTGGAYNYPTGGLPLQTGQQVIYQQPGHNVVISNGQVTQVPTGVPTGQVVYQ